MCSGGVCIVPGVRAQEGALQRLSSSGEARQGALYARPPARRDRDPVLWHHHQPQKGALSTLLINFIRNKTEIDNKGPPKPKDEERF
jgi:hypothetical protein